MERVYAVTVRLLCLRPATADSARETRRMVRDAAVADDRLEHIYVEPTGRGADLVMFLVAADLDAAERTAARLVHRARLADHAGCWPVTCQVELIARFAEAALPPDPPSL